MDKLANEIKTNWHISIEYSKIFLSIKCFSECSITLIGNNNGN